MPPNHTAVGRDAVRLTIGSHNIEMTVSYNRERVRVWEALDCSTGQFLGSGPVLDGDERLIGLVKPIRSASLRCNGPKIRKQLQAAWLAYCQG